MHLLLGRLHRHGLHVHRTVRLRCLSLEVGPVALPVLASHVLGLPLERLHDGLSLASVTSAGLLGALHEDVLLYQVCISLLCQLVTLTRGLELLGDDTEALVTVKRSVGNLSLEGEVSDRRHINILNREKL